MIHVICKLGENKTKIYIGNVEQSYSTVYIENIQQNLNKIACVYQTAINIYLFFGDTVFLTWNFIIKAKDVLSLIISQMHHSK